MSMKSCLEYLGTMCTRYKKVPSKAEKSQIIDEIVNVLGYHRKYAVQVLNNPVLFSRLGRAVAAFCEVGIKPPAGYIYVVARGWGDTVCAGSMYEKIIPIPIRFPIRSVRGLKAMYDEVKKEASLPGVASEINGSDDRKVILTEFTASVLQPNNFSGAISLPLSATPMVLAALTGAQALSLNAGERVWLTGTVGWQALSDGIGTSRVDVIFRIFRNIPVNGPQVLSIRESAEASFDTFKATSFDHVDINPVFEDNQLVSYFLTAELPLAGSAANVIGPISFTAAEIEPNT